MPSEIDPGKSTSRLEDFLGHVVDAIAGPVITDDIVVTYPRPDIRRHMPRVAHNIHMLFNKHGFVLAN